VFTTLETQYLLFLRWSTLQLYWYTTTTKHKFGSGRFIAGPGLLEFLKRLLNIWSCKFSIFKWRSICSAEWLVVLRFCTVRRVSQSLFQSRSDDVAKTKFWSHTSILIFSKWY